MKERIGLQNHVCVTRRLNGAEPTCGREQSFRFRWKGRRKRKEQFLALFARLFVWSRVVMTRVVLKGHLPWSRGGHSAKHQSRGRRAQELPATAQKTTGCIALLALNCHMGGLLFWCGSVLSFQLDLRVLPDRQAVGEKSHKRCVKSAFPFWPRKRQALYTYFACSGTVDDGKCR